MSTALPPRPDMGGEPRFGGSRTLGPPPVEPAPWKPIETLAIFFLALVVAALVGVALGLLSPGCNLTRPTAACGPVFVATSFAQEAAFLGAVVFWVRVVDRAPLRALGLRSTPLGDAGFGLLSGVALVVVGFVSGIVVSTVASAILGHPPPQHDQIPRYVQHGSLIWSSILAVLAAPLGEEPLFRGFLYRGLRRRWSVWTAALASAFFFALVHIDPGAVGGSLVTAFALFPIGVGLALIYERRQSLVASMVAHATFNLVGILYIASNR